MDRLLKIGIIGCGAIGGSLAGAITKDMSAQAAVCALYDIDVEKTKLLSKIISKRRDLSSGSYKELIEKSDLVIEAASAKNSWDIAKQVLSGGCDILIMSVGGIVEHFQELTLLARKNKSKVYIPSGAIAGVDALKAAKTGKITKVVLTTSKNPVSFKGVQFVENKGIKLDRIKKDTLLFSGTARQAVKYFPQNINVAGVLSIAGIGPQRTYVRIIAVPSLKRNVHEIEIQSNAGTIFTRTENVLHPDNPKTSYLAVSSAIAVLRRILEPVTIGT